MFHNLLEVLMRLLTMASILCLLVASTGWAGNEKVTLYGCEGVMYPNGTVACRGACTHKCAEVTRNVNPSSPYPDDLQLFDSGIPTFQSECLYLGTSEDGTQLYVIIP